MLGDLHDLTRTWFDGRFAAPTDAQRLGWPAILGGHDVLLAAPTGSGKTLAAFLVCIDRLVRLGLDGRLTDGVHVVYVSPLRALSNDMRRNLETPLAEINQLARERGLSLPTLRAAVRTGDTTQSDRQAMVRKPPHIVVTTPESLYLLLTGAKSREMLRSVDTVIVDEIHALARDKRGSHLSLSLERLDALRKAPVLDGETETLFGTIAAFAPDTRPRPQRIGLSATQRPMEEIARYLTGTGRDDACRIVDVGHARELDLAVEVPPSELEAVCSHETWEEVYERLTQLIDAHRSTIVFVNTRRLAERVTHQLTSRLGEDAIASHHGSLAQNIRHSTETRLKAGALKAVVATASLELGIDVGHIDLVCQLGSPRSIATFLQRVGRSGHALGVVPKGRLFALTRDELIESLALLRAAKAGRLDCIEIPTGPIDILAQQIVAATACEEQTCDGLYDLMRGAAPYRDLQRERFDQVVEMLAEGITHRSGRGRRYLHYDRIGGRLRARPGARITAVTCGGAIPEMADYRVVTEGERTFVGTVDEDFAIESMAGDIFLLGNTSWRIRHVRGSEVTVVDAGGAPPTIPFWRGEAPGRTAELSAEVSALRADLAAHDDEPAAIDALRKQVNVSEFGATQAVRYVAAQKAALGVVPTQRRVVFERFFDEAGGMQLVLHAPFGSRLNRAWGLALRKSFCRTFNFELQASADDDGIVLSLGPQHSFPLEQMFTMVRPHTVRTVLEQAVLAVPMFALRWRWNATRALSVLRQNGGKRVPPQLQRMRSDDVLAAVFPQQAACLEHIVGDIEIPDHILVAQTMHDCMTEAMDFEALMLLLTRMQVTWPGENACDEASASSRLATMPEAVELLARDTREPSPFCYELLNANPYAFLDDAPLEERRARAVATRRSLTIESVRDLGRLDPEAIRRVRDEAWPLVRNGDELHDALWTLGALPAVDGVKRAWSGWFGELVAAGRAMTVRCGDGVERWVSAERWPMVNTALGDVVATPTVTLPATVRQDWTAADARVALVRGWTECVGPTTASQLASTLGLERETVQTALEALEGEGAVLRGRFTHTGDDDTREIEWCDRRLLARIHRLTLDGLRRQIEPVPVDVFMRFLFRHQHVHSDTQRSGRAGLFEIIGQMQGFEVPAAAWERALLGARMQPYEMQWLDELTLCGDVTWGRLNGPRARTDDSTPFPTLTRVVPISLCVRDDLDWLIDQSTSEHDVEQVSSRAAMVLDLLRGGGAMFFADLVKRSGLLAAEAETVLGELVAAGQITSDGFGALRALIKSPTDKRRVEKMVRRRNGRRRSRAPREAGRWSLLADRDNDAEPVDADERIEAWCRQLLERYGVMFRELLARETSAPGWRDLVRVYRKLEARGEIRGGRFVADVSGEQYALPGAVGALRRLRDEEPDRALIVVSAVDPLNLVGIVTDGPRVPATASNALVYHQGRLVGFHQGGETHITAEASAEMAAALPDRLSGRAAPARVDTGPAVRFDRT